MPYREPTREEYETWNRSTAQPNDTRAKDREQYGRAYDPMESTWGPGAVDRMHSNKATEASLRDGGGGATHAYRACERQCLGDSFFAKCRDDCFSQFYADRGLKTSNIHTWHHDHDWKGEFGGGMTENMGAGSFGGGDSVC